MGNSSSFFFSPKKKAAVLLCTDIAAQEFGYVLYQDPEMKHLAQFSFFCRSFIYCLRSIYRYNQTQDL